MKASITIEGSIIYPLLIICSVSIIIYCFNTHDRLSAKASIHKALIENYNNEDSPLTLSDLNEIIDKTCLIPNSLHLTYDAKTRTASILSDSYKSTISFNDFERCKFIRTYYSLLHFSD